MKKKVLLVSLSLNDKYPPLGIANIKSYALKNNLIRDNFDIVLESYQIDSFKDESLLNLFERLNPEIVGFTSRSWCKNKIINISKKIKERFPDLMVIVGGPEVDESFLEKGCIDVLVYGRGELPFMKILELRLVGGDMKNVPSIMFKENNKIISTGHAPLTDLNEIPSPYLNNIIDLDRYPCPVIQAEYGCESPKCFYCEIHEKEMPKKYFSLERIKEEISLILRKSDFMEIINCNLNLSHRRFIQILGFIKEAAGEKSKVILWLDYNALKPEDAEIIKSINGKKVMEFNLFVPKGHGIDFIKQDEIESLSRAISLLKDERIDFGICVILDSQPKDQKKDISYMYDSIKNNLKGDNTGLNVYIELTGKNYYDKS